MSLGFHNTAFPDTAEFDKINDFYNASYHYNSHTTASLSVSASYSDSITRGTGTACCALANNGNIAVIFEQSSTATIIEGQGGTQTNISVSGGGTTWRGMNYDPKSDRFVALANRYAIIEATSPYTYTNYGSTFYGTEIWGGVMIDGILYYGPAYSTQATQIAGFDVSNGNTSYVGPVFPSETHFQSPCVTIDGTMVFGPGGDFLIKEVNLLNDTFSTLTSTNVINFGFQGWAPLPDGRLWNVGWNKAFYNLYTPASLNGGTSKLEQPSKISLNGPWSNCFLGLDGKGYYVNSKGVSQLGGTYSDVYCFDPSTDNFFLTQFKFPAASTGGDRQNQAICVLPDGWVFSAGSNGSSQHHFVKMFEPVNDITLASRTAGFVPNTGN